jgi:hypothetical protein
MQNVAAMGLNPGTPEYQEAIRTALMKPQNQIIFGDKPVSPADLERFVDAEGNPPPTIMTPTQLREGGYRLSRKPTEADRRSAYVADSLSTASRAVENILEKPAFNPSSMLEAAKSVSNWTASSEYQRYKSSADEWATNMVFLRSGATAREEEKSAAFSNFWPQPGDKKETRDFKTKLRLEQEINAYSMAAMGGRITQEKAQEKIGQIRKRLDKLGGGQTATSIPMGAPPPPPGFVPIP